MRAHEGRRGKSENEVNSFNPWLLAFFKDRHRHSGKTDIISIHKELRGVSLLSLVTGVSLRCRKESRIYLRKEQRVNHCHFISVAVHRSINGRILQGWNKGSRTVCESWPGWSGLEITRMCKAMTLTHSEDGHIVQWSNKCMLNVQKDPSWVSDQVKTRTAFLNKWIKPSGQFCLTLL